MLSFEYSSYQARDNVDCRPFCQFLVDERVYRCGLALLRVSAYILSTLIDAYTYLYDWTIYKAGLDYTFGEVVLLGWGRRGTGSSRMRPSRQDSSRRIVVGMRIECRCTRKQLRKCSLLAESRQQQRRSPLRSLQLVGHKGLRCSHGGCSRRVIDAVCL
jgi:hypothetical protein